MGSSFPRVCNLLPGLKVQKFAGARGWINILAAKHYDVQGLHPNAGLIPCSVTNVTDRLGRMGEFHQT